MLFYISFKFRFSHIEVKFLVGKQPVFFSVPSIIQN